MKSIVRCSAISAAIVLYGCANQAPQLGPNPNYDVVKNAQDNASTLRDFFLRTQVYTGGAQSQADGERFRVCMSSAMADGIPDDVQADILAGVRSNATENQKRREYTLQGEWLDTTNRQVLQRIADNAFRICPDIAQKYLSRNQS